MKKIMFNDKYGLTAAVLNGTKTQTRRLVPQSFFKPSQVWEDNTGNGDLEFMDAEGDWHKAVDSTFNRYHRGDIVAVAQAYKEFMSVEEHTKFLFNERNGLYMGYPEINPEEARKDIRKFIGNSNGWTNKMFVKADLMPHQIRITRVWIERLQDISYEDCLKEGVVAEIVGYTVGIPYKNETVRFVKQGKSYALFNTTREAYAALIDKVSGKGTWDSNPYVYCYEFELVK